jgi:hypothetical protein
MLHLNVEGLTLTTASLDLVLAQCTRLHTLKVPFKERQLVEKYKRPVTEEGKESEQENIFVAN